MYRISAHAVLEGRTYNAATTVNPMAEVQREKIELDIRLFLIRGGKINQIPNGVSANPLTESQKAMTRRKKK